MWNTNDTSIEDIWKIQKASLQFRRRNLESSDFEKLLLKFIINDAKQSRIKYLQPIIDENFPIPCNNDLVTSMNPATKACK